MEGKEAIIKRIISDAEKKAKSITEIAKADALERETDAKSWAEDYVGAQEKILTRDAEDVVTRRKTVAELDVRKITLKAKQDIISKVFDEVLAKLCALKKADYLKLVEEKMIESAEIGDTVVLSKDGVLTDKDVSGLKVFSDKKLSVSKDKGEFIGGVYLEGEKCDKDLTFSSIVEEKRGELTATVAEELFGKN